MHSSARREPEKAAGAAGHRSIQVRPGRSCDRFDPRAGGVLAFYAAAAVTAFRKIDKITSGGVARARSNSTTLLPAAGGGLAVKYNYDAPVAEQRYDHNAKT